MTSAKTFAVVLISAVCVLGNNPTSEWTNLKVTYGVTPFTSFNSMPRTAREAQADGWSSYGSKNCTNGGKFFGVRYFQGDDISVALLYDANGIIAGIQMNLIKKEILTPQNPYRFDLVSMYQSDVINGKEVFVLTAYFVEPSTICTTGRSNQDLKRGTGTMLKFQNGPTPLDLINVPLKRSEAIKEGWSKNSCFFGMGYHNFYKSEEFEATNCLQIRPAFLLFNSAGSLHGFGLAAPGYAKSSRFEHPPGFVLQSIVGKNVAQCMKDTANTIGYSTMHVYFVDRPYLIHCFF